MSRTLMWLNLYCWQAVLGVIQKPFFVLFWSPTYWIHTLQRNLFRTCSDITVSPCISRTWSSSIAGLNFDFPILISVSAGSAASSPLAPFAVSGTWSQIALFVCRPCTYSSSMLGWNFNSSDLISVSTGLTASWPLVPFAINGARYCACTLSCCRSSAVFPTIYSFILNSSLLFKK